MLSALMMMRRMTAAVRVAVREQDFAQILAAALVLIAVGTVTYTLGEDWSVVDGFYVAVATLTTSSILDPDLTLAHGWLKVFTAFYVLTGIGILSRSPGASAWDSSGLGQSARRPRRKRRGPAPRLARGDFLAPVPLTPPSQQGRSTSRRARLTRAALARPVFAGVVPVADGRARRDRP